MKYVFALLILLALGIAAFTILASFSGHAPALLDPKGTIALQERDLMSLAVRLMLVIVIPVFILTFAIAWRYRAGNTKAKYSPEWDHNIVDEIIWWALPCFIILVLGTVTWKSTHELDPFRPLVSDAKPLTIQVVALNWKWLFIYPQQGIATVNFVQFPERTPIDFEITADAPMNSFWIPQLGGQIYAMTGMSSHLHLMADGAGTYAGSSANFSGQGFSGMKFTAQSGSQKDFEEWVAGVKQSGQTLDANAYAALEAPSENNPPAYYASTEKDLYTTILMKFMPHTQNMNAYGMIQQ